MLTIDRSFIRRPRVSTSAPRLRRTDVLDDDGDRSRFKWENVDGDPHSDSKPEVCLRGDHRRVAGWSSGEGEPRQRTREARSHGAAIKADIPRRGGGDRVGE